MLLPGCPCKALLQEASIRLYTQENSLWPPCTGMWELGVRALSED